MPIVHAQLDAPHCQTPESPPPGGKGSRAAADGRPTARKAALARELLIACALAASPAAAQTCSDTHPPGFQGHAFPLDSTAVPTSYRVVDAFPSLSVRDIMTLVPSNDGSDRLFAVDRDGVIRHFHDDPAADEITTFLDIQSRVHRDGNHLGLLDMAFHPEFSTNGFLYVYYSARSPRCESFSVCALIERYQVDPSNPDVADPGSAFRILEREQPTVFHIGGRLLFGPDGYLYASTGDGGTSSSQNSAQDNSTLVGAILRIDVDGGIPYAIPPDNPLVGVPGARAERFHWGFKNPWRFSFDSETGDMWIGDVGASRWEEINLAPAGTRGLNFGWNFCQNDEDSGDFSCADVTDHTLPEFAYFHDQNGGSIVVGGVVYRGSRFPELFGKYIFADRVSGRIWSIDGSGGAVEEIARLPLRFVAIVERPDDGELYLAELDSISRLEPGETGNPEFPATLSETQLFSDAAALIPAPGMVEYEVNAPLWSDRALKTRWMALPEGETIEFHPTAAWTLPVGTVLVKHFELPTSATERVRIETRVMLRQVQDWVGYTYRWNAAQTEATIVLEHQTEDFQAWTGSATETQTWTYPSPGACLGCHTQAAGRVLSVRTRQVHRAGPPAGENQLHDWDCRGLFSQRLPELTRFGAYPALDDSGAPRVARARAYLAANCELCHQPGAPAPGGLDLRYDGLLAELGAIGVPPTEGDIGLPSPARIRPGDRSNSVLWERIRTGDPLIRMPKLGSVVAHDEAVTLIGRWINGLTPSLDSDADGVPDPSDTCPRSSAPQTDRGGFGLGSGPDGIGDACQCFDVDASGTADGSDARDVRRWLAGGLDFSGTTHRLCAGAEDGPGTCTLLDAVQLRRALGGVPPQLDPANCPAGRRVSP